MIKALEVLFFLFSCFLVYQVWLAEAGTNLSEEELTEDHYEAGYLVYMTGVVASFIALVVTFIKLIS